MHAMKVLGLFDCTSKASAHYHHGGGVDTDILETHRAYLQSQIAATIGRTASPLNVVAFLLSLKKKEQVRRGTSGQGDGGNELYRTTP